MPEPAPTRPPVSSLATASLVLGVLSLVLFVVAPLFAVPAIVCGHLARRRSESAPRPDVGLRGARAGQIMGIIGIGVWVFFLVFLFIGLPGLTSQREMARRINCRANFNCLWCASKMYASDYDGAFPPDFRVLVEMKYLDSFRIYACPSAKTKLPTSLDEFVSGGQGDYAYFGAGLNEKTVKYPDKTILIADKTGNHVRYWNVCMVDYQRFGLTDPHNLGFAAAARQRGWIIPGGSPAP